MRQLWRRFRAWVRRYFGFSYREVNGFIVLLFIMIALLAAPPLYDYYAPSQTTDYTKDKPLLDSMLAAINRLDTSQNFTPRYANITESELEKPEAQLFYFNPNLISAEQWQQLGLKKFMAERIVKYRSKGGKFRKKEDVKKIYGFPEELYARLEPYIQLADKQEDKFARKDRPNFPKRDSTRPRFEKREPRITTFDLNTADTAQLSKVRGIGQGYANRIIKYRDNLGGFYDTSQVREVFGLPPETVNELLRFGRVQAEIRKLNINQAEADLISKHPYLRGKGKVIVAYRNQHGNFQTADNLLKIRILDPAMVEKVKPYLEF
jgi:competence protein ComEA